VQGRSPNAIKLSKVKISEPEIKLISFSGEAKIRGSVDD